LYVSQVIDGVLQRYLGLAVEVQHAGKRRVGLAAQQRGDTQQALGVWS
jgi:hypothetical protein